MRKDVENVTEGSIVSYVPEGKLDPVEAKVLKRTLWEAKLEWEEGGCSILIKTVPLHEVLEVIEPAGADSNKSIQGE